MGSLCAQRIVFTPQWIAQGQFAGYYVAQELGFYEEAGVEVEIRHTSTSEPALDRMLRGECNAITMQLVDAMYNIAKGVEMVNILQTNQRSAHVIIARYDDIKTIDDLNGRRVGIWRTGGVQLAQLVGLDYGLDIEWVPFIESINLYISGAIDATLAMVYNEIYWIVVSGFLGQNVILLSDLGYDYPEEGLYVSRDYYERYPEQAKAFAEASRRGWEWAHEHREEALEIVLKVMQQEGIPTSRNHQKWMIEDVLEFQCPQDVTKPTFRLEKEKVDGLNALLLKHGHIKSPVTVEMLEGR